MLQSRQLVSTFDRFSERPTPLGPRNPNASPRFSSTTPSDQKVAREGPRRIGRQSLQNPLLQRKVGDEQEKRRRSFLRKVRQASDDKRWEARGNQILRHEYMEGQRRWMREKDTSACEEHLALDDDPQQEDLAFIGDRDAADILQHLVSQEESEFEALVSLMGHQHSMSADPPQAQAECGSDDEEYDRLFMEIMGETRPLAKDVSSARIFGQADGQEMDMELG
ncbi:MAG: hypothetical protein Q9163_002101 [Psora crenata]